MSQLATSHIAHAWTLRKQHLNLWKRKGKWVYHKYLYYMLDLCARWTTRVTSSRTYVHLQRGHATT